MTNHNEKLSCLLDDYRNTNEDQSVLQEAQADVNQQYTLHRYQMIGDVMRNEMPQNIQLDFAAQVKSRLQQEAVYNIQTGQAEEVEKPASWLWSMFFKPAAGLAVAAVVAVVTVSTLQSPSIEQDETQSVATADSSQARVEQLASVPVVSQSIRVSGTGDSRSSQQGMNWKIKRGEPEMQNKLNTYLINHNEYSNSLQGIIPQARVVGFDGQ